MLFKNLIIYKTKKDLFQRITSESLAEFTFIPCGSQDSSKMGFISPINEDGVLIYTIDYHSVISILREDKILPTDVINKAWQEKITKLETVQDRKLKKIEKDTLRDEVLIDLLPQAFTRTKRTNIWINHKDNFIAIDCTTFKKAEDCLSLLRKALGSLAIVPLNIEFPAQQYFTNWVKSRKAPTYFEFLDDAVLEDPLDGQGKIRASSQDLTAEEIMAHIDSGKQVTTISLHYKESTSFTINSHLNFSRIKFTHEFMDDEENGFDAVFLLIANELSNLVNDLMNSFK